MLDMMNATDKGAEMEHDFCRSLYHETCRAYGIKSRSLTAYTYERGFGQHQVTKILSLKPKRRYKTMGDYSGCCKWSAKTAYIDSNNSPTCYGNMP